MHKSRSNRKANELRKKNSIFLNTPLSQEGQQMRANDRKKTHEKMYPTAPTYKKPPFGAKGRI